MILERLREIHQRVTTRGMTKEQVELRYWQQVWTAEGGLAHDHYEWFYTGEFGLSRDDYAGRRVLDIGCGPRGSLEWADGAAERVGVDPLADDYRALGTDRQAMTYVTAPAESLPFADGHFDVVVSFNALDHVEDPDAAIREMTRVTRPGGAALLIVEVAHRATPTEPQSLPWSLLERFDGWEVVREKRTGIDRRHNVYESFRAGLPHDDGPGILGARLRRL